MTTTAVCCVFVWETSPPLPHWGRKWGWEPGKCPPSPGICIGRGWWGGRESEGEKVPREMRVPAGGWEQGGASLSQSV